MCGEGANMPKSPSVKIVERLDQIIPVVMKAFNAQNPRDLEDQDITIPQLIVLKMLLCKDNRTMSEIAGSLSVTLAAATGIVDRLVRDKYVKRIEDTEDRRIVRVQILGKGKKVAKKMIDSHRRRMVHIFNQIPKRDQINLLKIFENLYSIVVKKNNSKI